MTVTRFFWGRRLKEEGRGTADTEEAQKLRGEEVERAAEKGKKARARFSHFFPFIYLRNRRFPSSLFLSCEKELSILKT